MTCKIMTMMVALVSFAIITKGQEISEVFFLSPIPPKNQRNFFSISDLASKKCCNEKNALYYVK